MFLCSVERSERGLQRNFVVVGASVDVIKEAQGGVERGKCDDDDDGDGCDEDGKRTQWQGRHFVSSDRFNRIAERRIECASRSISAQGGLAPENRLHGTS